jgi:hypothetical protein
VKLGVLSNPTGSKLGRPDDGEAFERWRKFGNGVDSGSSAVKVWTMRNKGILWSSSRCWLGQTRSEVIGRRWRMPTVEKSGRSESLAIGSSLMVLLHPQWMKAERLNDLDGKGRASWWPVIASKVAGRGEMSKAWERRSAKRVSPHGHALAL